LEARAVDDERAAHDVHDLGAAVLVRHDAALRRDADELQPPPVLIVQVEHAEPRPDVAPLALVGPVLLLTLRQLFRHGALVYHRPADAAAPGVCNVGGRWRLRFEPLRAAPR